jgi:hypothetical protein
MSKYLPVKEVGGSVAIATCYRCGMKRYYGDLEKDPNNQNYFCKHGCIDIYDPWRLPARQAEDISLHHPRPDTTLT